MAFYVFYIGYFILSDKILDMRIKVFAPEEYQYENLTPEQKSMVDHQIGDGGRNIFFLYFAWIVPLILALFSYLGVRIIKFLSRTKIDFISHNNQ